jgi:parallel beta-helix repeat protein
MRVDRRVLGSLAVLAALTAGCDNTNGSAKNTGKQDTGKADAAKSEKTTAATKAAAGNTKVVHIKPGANVQDETQEALIKAKPGTVIEFDEGTFNFTKGLSLTVENVTVRGKGIDKTILSFKKQDEGKEGLIVTRGKFVLEDLTIQDTKGNATKVEGADGVTYRNVKTEWTGDAKASNGAYGVYPVSCKNVLIDGCVAIGASDAGIYVGQTENVIVRKCRAEKNVAGIEIENCINADVYDNVATNNAGGLLVFDLPGLQLKNGHNVKVHDNQVFGNNHANFAPEGNMVADVAPGTGMMVMATDHVELLKNTIKDNKTYGLIIVSFLITQRKMEDKDYDPYPEAVYAHDNTFEGNGKEPTGKRAAMLVPLLGTPVPEIIYDGIVNPKKLVDGKLPDDLRVVFKDNGPISVVNMHWDQLDPMDLAGAKAKVERNPKSMVGELPPLPAVKLAEVK